ncbi:MAG: LysR family transcriptional regulator [Betaproteobacteria bacterium]|nr:LysR family transcriptional regulator [Betaproteobacteria bacterium]
MTLTQLRHFVTLAEIGSFAQTARVVFLTQPALTRSIAALEEELGERLFDRVGRRIILTPFGREVLDRAQRLVRDTQTLKSLRQGLQSGMNGQLKLGLGSGPGALFSHRLLRHMAQHHPRLRLYLSRGSTEVLLQGLKSQRLDAAIVDIRAMRPSTDFEVSHSFELVTGFLVRPEHPLLSQTQLSLTEILAYPLASTTLSDEVARMLMEDYGPEANPDHMVTLMSDETSHIVDIARHTDGVVLTIVDAARDLISLPIKPPMRATARFGLVTLDKRQEAPALRIVREQLPQWINEISR